MGPVFIVGPEPLLREALHVLQGLEEIEIEHFVAIGAVEALDERVLIRVAGRMWRSSTPWSARRMANGVAHSAGPLSPPSLRPWPVPPAARI